MACSNNRSVVGVIDFIYWWENNVIQPCLAVWSPRCSGRVQEGQSWLEGGFGWFCSPALSLSFQGLGEMSEWNVLSQQRESLLPGLRSIPLERSGVWKAWLRKGGVAGGWMGTALLAASILLIWSLTMGMNLKWISGVSAKAGYFCHNWHVRQSESTAIQWDGEEKGRRTWCFSGYCTLQVQERCFHLGPGAQGKFSASPNWRTLSETS